MLKLKKPHTEATMAYSAIDIANVFIKFGIGNGKPITHMQLQKLLYYAQGWYIGLSDGTPLFPEPFNKWPFGPVCPSVYNKLKKSKGTPIFTLISGTREIKDADITQYLRKIWDIYGRYSGPQLMMFSHSEEPWINTPDYEQIPQNAITNFFKEKHHEFAQQEIAKEWVEKMMTKIRLMFRGFF